ncbi:MAG: HAD hydrolase-like protein [Gammaproteobacteria bacterium]|nr:HAD hydrolase-like protein [Gammaproteobacteria bacterium]
MHLDIILISMPHRNIGVTHNSMTVNLKYKLVIFDFDGTLADTVHLFMDITNKAADKFNFNQIQDHERDRLRGFSARQICQHLNVAWWKIPSISVYMRSSITKHLNMINLFSGVSDMLEYLSNHDVKLAIVSSNSMRNIAYLLGPKNTALIYAFECDTKIFGKSKRLKKIISQLEIKRHEAIYVGDEIRDMDASKKIQMASGAVAWGYTTSEALKNQFPDEFFESMEDLRNKIVPANRMGDRA